MYITTTAFYDLKDPVKFSQTKDGRIPVSYYAYVAGEIYPRYGAPAPSAQRIEELLGDGNALRKPLIRFVPDEALTPVPQAAQEAEMPAEPVRDAAGKAQEPATEAKKPETGKRPAKAAKPAKTANTAGSKPKTSRTAGKKASK